MEKITRRLHVTISERQYQRLVALAELMEDSLSTAVSLALVIAETDIDELMLMLRSKHNAQAQENFSQTVKEAIQQDCFKDASQKPPGRSDAGRNKAHLK